MSSRATWTTICLSKTRCFVRTHARRSGCLCAVRSRCAGCDARTLHFCAVRLRRFVLRMRMRVACALHGTVSMIRLANRTLVVKRISGGVALEIAIGREASWSWGRADGVGWCGSASLGDGSPRACLQEWLSNRWRFQDSAFSFTNSLSSSIHS